MLILLLCEQSSSGKSNGLNGRVAPIQAIAFSRGGLLTQQKNVVRGNLNDYSVT